MVSLITIVFSTIFIILAYSINRLISNQFEYGNFKFVDNRAEALNTVKQTYPSTTIIENYVKTNDAFLHYYLFKPNEKVFKPSKDGYSVIIIANGLGTQKDMGLYSHANAFAEAGYAAIVFDYETFGGSYIKKSPNFRNFVWPWDHVKNLKSVAEYVLSGSLSAENINKNSVSLFGTSFGGGHVVQVANELNGSIRSVISQVPHLDGKAASVRGIKQRGTIGTIRVAVLAITDYVFGFIGLQPIYVKIVGSFNDVAYMMLSDEHKALYFAKHPTTYLGGWKNLAPARSLLSLSFYNPIKVIPNIK